MGRPHWADEVQYPFLAAKAEAYKAIKGRKKPRESTKFFDDLFDEWKEKFPNSELSQIVSGETGFDANGKPRAPLTLKKVSRRYCGFSFEH